MPELPDVVVYLEALTRHVVGRALEKINVLSPFVLRSVSPPVEACIGARVRAARRIGKRIVLVFDGDLFLVIHLMIAGRLRWRPASGPETAVKRLAMPPKTMLATLGFAHGTLFFTEASSKKRASLQVVQGEDALRAIDRGGLEPLGATLEQVHAALTVESHTLKRALTAPHLFSGIGNAYSDEILHAARLSPLKLTRSLSDAEFLRLHAAIQSTLILWIDRLRRQTGDGFPEAVTAFHPEMAVHGRFKQPCPVCGSPIQRIVYAENECNYCAACQTNGKLLADRSLSRLLRSDWPSHVEE
jgi:formamidopyrimidine-DNA glycosylase